MEIFFCILVEKCFVLDYGFDLENDKLKLNYYFATGDNTDNFFERGSFRSHPCGPTTNVEP